MTEKRAAHRPSRRGAAIEAAVRLTAEAPQSSISVAQIAEEAGMTAAAVYYHYANKDDVLEEGLSNFAMAMRDEVENVVESGAVTELPAHLLEWCDGHRDAAVVWFVHSGRLSMRMEAIRRDTNGSIITALTRVLRSAGSGTTLPHAAVMAAALQSLLEVSARSWLTDDPTLVAGRREDFKDEVAALARRIVKVPAPQRSGG